MSIAVGDTLPEVELRMMVEGAPASMSSKEILGSGRVVLFAVPGAFTPGCSKVHFPGYVELAASISEAGVDSIACISVNDVFVMDAWGQAQSAGDILMLADPDAEFAKAVGLEVDASGFGLGIRSKRYALVLQDGVVVAFLPEEDGFSVMASTAACVLAGL
jgi:peroxiredoxin